MKIVLLGDSIMLSLFGNALSVMTAGGRIVSNLSASGHTVANQLAVWLASSQRGDPTIDCAVIHVSINDIRTGVPVATTKADMDTLRNDMRTNNPNMKIVFSMPLPARNNQDVRPRYYSHWLTLTAFWSSPASVVLFDSVVPFAVADADDGFGGLRSGTPWFGEVDGLHPGVAGNKLHASYLRWGIDEAMGLLSCCVIDHTTRSATGGWRDNLGMVSSGSSITAQTTHKCNVCP